MNSANRRLWDAWFWTMVWLMAELFSAQAPSLAAGSNLIYNGDFELSSSQIPPPGWEAWGSRENISAYFTGDHIYPHGGRACLRIYHPAGSVAYIVSSPDYAIKTKKGNIYTLSFWARTNIPGQSLAGFAAYQNINPYVEAQAPIFPIEVGQGWKQYIFEIKEGFDFSAESSRYLMLVFKATTLREEEKTLWIDDVVVTE